MVSCLRLDPFRIWKGTVEKSPAELAFYSAFQGTLKQSKYQSQTPLNDPG
jgi:hypothetical protein